MKKWSMLLAAALICTLACPMGSLAAENPKAQYGTPVIDGQIDDIWNTSDTIAVVWAGDESATRYNASDRPLAGSYAKVMWDQENLYFLIYASADKTPSDPAYAPSSVQAFMTEQVTLFVSETADDMGEYYENSGNWQLLVNPYEASSNPSTGFLTTNTDESKHKTATARCVRNTGDYICEVSIPWTQQGDHLEGDWIGFNFIINDDMDENGTRDYYVSWANPSYQRYWEEPDLPIVELAGGTAAVNTTAATTTAVRATTTTRAAPTNGESPATKATTTHAATETTAGTALPTEEPDSHKHENSTSLSPTSTSASPVILDGGGDGETGGGFSPLWIVLIVAAVLVIAGGVVFLLYWKKIGPFSGRSSGE